MNGTFRASVAVLGLLAPLLVAITARRGATQKPSSSTDSIVHLYQGQDSHTHYVLRAVVEDSASFARLWDQIVTAPTPRVDFNRYLVIAATMGPGTPGDKITIVGVDSGAPILGVRVALRLRQGPGLPAVTYPADVVRVPKSRRVGVTFVDRYNVVRSRE